MNINQSNARFSRVMGDHKHTKHAMEINKKFWRERLKFQFGFDIWQLPVCGRCEGYALWHKDKEGNPVGQCQCGHVTKNPITVEKYYEQGFDVDRSIRSQTPVVAERSIVLPNQVVDIDNQKIIVARR